jgi:hypothetical protein
MTLVVEDGHGLPTANAYIDVAFADAYFSLRGITAWASAVSADKEIAIVKATDYIDTVWGWKFLGTKANAKTNPPDFAVDQALEWPRMYQRQDLPIALPPQLQKACAEYALRALLNGTPLLADPEVEANGLTLTGSTEKVGPIDDRQDVPGRWCHRHHPALPGCRSAPGETRSHGWDGDPWLIMSS